jgi:4-hydroxybenzoate polyprenyltransferase
LGAIVNLYVDLDGTLVRTDTLVEGVLELLRLNPAYLLLLPFWLLGGRAAFKDRIAERVALDPESLPYNEPLIDHIREKREAYQRVVLATACHRRWADEIARHVGLFDGVLATTADDNLKGERKLQAIQADAKGEPTAYAGNDRSDLSVWAGVDAAIVVDAPSQVGDAVADDKVTERIVTQTDRLRAMLKAIRVHQWLKNLLIFLPIVAAHQLFDWAAVLPAVLAFFAFSFFASANYIVNDLLDLPSDRRHPTKRKRPFASGALPLQAGAGIVAVLVLGGVVLAAMLPGAFALSLIAYLALTLAYSLRLKRIMMLDVVVLAMLYTARIVAGSAATGIELSFWLLAFSLFIFLSLATVKRSTELATMLEAGRERASGRGYHAGDLPVVNQIGVASGLLSVLVLALYINSEGVAQMYAHPQLIWLLCPLVLYWIGRMWVLCNRGEIEDDPVVFAIKDSRTHWVVICALLVLLVAA